MMLAANILWHDLLVDSYSGDYTEVVQVISSYLKQHTDAKVVIQKIAEKKSNVIAIFGKPTMLINCHMDTVPPTGIWASNPTIPVEKEGKIFGLGTTDTKGNIFVLLQAVKNNQPQNLMLLFSVDEESGSIDSGVTYFLDSNFKEGIIKAVVCEPTNLQLVNKHKGYYSFLIIFHTKAAHSSSLNKENAIVKAAGFIPILHKMGYNIAKISGGQRGNIIPSECRLNISIRTYEPYQTVHKKLQQIVSKGVDLTSLTILPSLQNEFESGEEVGFWTEAALFQEAGISAVVLGAGNISQAHTENEFIEEKELEKAQIVFSQFWEGE